MADFSGKILLRIPKDLHRKLWEKASENNSSLNNYIIYLLSNGIAETSNIQKLHDTECKSDNANIYGGVKMGQNTISGRLGNEFGRLIGQEIAKHLGIKLEEGTNKGTFRNREVVIKSARKKNTQFGITNKMLKEIDDVIVAKEVAEGTFDLYVVPINSILSMGRPAGGKNKDKVTNFSIAKAISNGLKLETLSIDMPY